MMPRTSAPISVVAAYYSDPREAVAALGSLSRLHVRHTIEIVDAAVFRLDNGSLRIVRRARVGPSGSEVGHEILDVIFPPWVLALSATGAAARVAEAHFNHQGFDNNLLKEIGENLPEGGAALVAVIEERWLAELAEIFAGYADLNRFAVHADTSVDWLQELGRSANR